MFAIARVPAVTTAWSAGGSMVCRRALTPICRCRPILDLLNTLSVRSGAGASAKPRNNGIHSPTVLFTSASIDHMIPRWRTMVAITVVASASQGCGARGDAAASGQGLLFVEDFESGMLAGWPDGVDPSRQRGMTGREFAQSGSHYLEVTYPAGGDGGWLTRFFMPGFDSLDVSYYIRLPPPPKWQGGTKLLAPYGARVDDQGSAAGKGGICPNGTDLFIAM